MVTDLQLYSWLEGGCKVFLSCWWLGPVRGLLVGFKVAYFCISISTKLNRLWFIRLHCNVRFRGLQFSMAKKFLSFCFIVLYVHALNCVAYHSKIHLFLSTSEAQPSLSGLACLFCAGAFELPKQETLWGVWVALYALSMTSLCSMVKHRKNMTRG